MTDNTKAILLTAEQERAIAEATEEARRAEEAETIIDSIWYTFLANLERSPGVNRWLAHADTTDAAAMGRIVADLIGDIDKRYSR